MSPVKTPRRPRRAPRRRSPPRWLKRTARLAWPVVLVVSVVGGGVWLALSGEAARIAATAGAEAVALSGRIGLRVDHVLVTGRQRVERETLSRALAVRRGMPIFAFDPHAAKARLESIPWIRSATVERRFPDTIYVRIAERQPLALWQRDGRLSLIDTAGHVIAREELFRYHRLPLVVGANAPAHAASIITALINYPSVHSRVHALVRVADRRWDIRFKNGVTARLPEEGAGRALATLARLIETDRLLERDVVMIDLRLADRLVVRTGSRGRGQGDGKPGTGARKRKSEGT